MKMRQTIDLHSDNYDIVNGYAVRVEYDEFYDMDEDPRNQTRMHWIMDMGRRNGGVFSSEGGDAYALISAVERQNIKDGIAPITQQYLLDENGEETDEENPSYVDFDDIRYNHNYGKLLEEAKKAGFWLANTYVYEHGARAFSLSSFNDPWDSCGNGVAWLSKEEMEKDGITPESAYREAHYALEELTNLDNGWVYCVGHAPVHNDDGEPYVNDDEFEWCGGFIGMDSVEDYVEELKSELEPPAPSMKQGSLLEIG